MIIAGLAVVAVALIGLGIYLNRPVAKVERLEQAAIDLKESSGYNACVGKVNEKIQKRTEFIKLKVQEAGYTDSMNCLENPSEPACKDTARYNAEVKASNDFMPLADQITPLSLIDCMELLNKATK